MAAGKARQAKMAEQKAIRDAEALQRGAEVASAADAKRKKVMHLLLDACLLLWLDVNCGCGAETTGHGSGSGQGKQGFV
jgi:hypothetical protein